MRGRLRSRISIPPVAVAHKLWIKRQVGGAERSSVTPQALLRVPFTLGSPLM